MRLVCPCCNRAEPQVNNTNAGTLECPDCGAGTTVARAAGTAPYCFIDGMTATHLSSNHRYFCPGCAPRVGLNDSHKVKEA